MLRFFIGPVLICLYGIPFTIAVVPFSYVNNSVLRIVLLVFAPAVFGASHAIVAGLLSRLFQHGIRRGKFPRDLRDKVYGPRRLYSLCWTSLYYFTPVYFSVLSIPILKRIVFRLFGYKGSMKFTTYPDTWLRDLPLLLIGENAYLSNKATLGTNMCLMDGTILVDTVTVEKNAIVGHLPMLAPGSYIGEGAEVGVGVCIGMGVRLMKGSKVGPNSVLNHGTVLGENAEVGTMSYVGVRVVVGDHVKIPGGANIPSGAKILSQQDVEKYLSSEFREANPLKDGFQTPNSINSQTSQGAS